MPPAQQETLLTQLVPLAAGPAARYLNLAALLPVIWEIIQPRQLHSPAGTKGTYLHPLKPASHHLFILVLGDGRVAVRVTGSAGAFRWLRQSDLELELEKQLGEALPDAFSGSFAGAVL